MSPTYWKLLEYAAFGGIGALIGAMTKSRSLQLPRVHVERRSNGEVVRFLDPGFLSAPALGAALAIYFDTRPENAIAWGLAAGFAGPSILNVVFDQLLKRGGYNPIPAPPARPEPQP